MFRREFAAAEMTCIPEAIHEAGDVAILETAVSATWWLTASSR